jgi:PAS domain S-box-containing protein
MTTEQPHPSILFVDDDEASRHALSQVLLSAGFQPREAATGTEALRLAEEKPDLIVLDVSLPDIDGFEVCRRIKAHPRTAAIPVLHMSGVFVGARDRAQALEGGADGYLTKPVEAREFVATVRALLRLHQAEEAARAAAGQWQATFDAVHDALGLLDPAGRLLRCNRALARLLGRPGEEALGQPLGALLRQVLGQPAEAVVGLLERGQPIQEREVHLAGRWFRLTADQVPGAPVAPTAVSAGRQGLVFLLTDVTGRKELESQLLQAAKMEAVGRLAGGVAHDFNNLLTAVLGNVDLALRELPAGHPAEEALRIAEQSAWRAAELTRQLLGFSRRAPHQPRPLDLGTCAEDTIGLLTRTLGRSVEVELRVAPGLWPVHADPTQMGQVLMNLVLNARDAMPTGGKVVVELANVTFGEEEAGRPVEAPAGQRDFVRLRVIDTGAGMSDEVKARIFEPFFTTKESGKGTGLGLAVVHGIVRQHGGWVESESQVGRGSTFIVTLPRYTGPT